VTGGLIAQVSDEGGSKSEPSQAVQVESWVQRPRPPEGCRPRPYGPAASHVRPRRRVRANERASFERVSPPGGAAELSAPGPTPPAAEVGGDGRLHRPPRRRSDGPQTVGSALPGG